MGTRLTGSIIKITHARAIAEPRFLQKSARRVAYAVEVVGLKSD